MGHIDSADILRKIAVCHGVIVSFADSRAVFIAVLSKAGNNESDKFL